MSLLIHNAMLCDSRRAPRRGWISVRDGIIAAVGDGDAPADTE